MKKAVLIALIGSVALASCNSKTAPDVSGTSKSVAFKAMLPDDATYKASAGTARYVDLTGDDRRTTLTATGLKPNTSYLAHYHKLGTASTDPCKSSGAIVGGVIGEAVTSNASGAVTLKGFQSTAALAGATYINIHEAAALGVVPLCAPL